MDTRTASIVSSLFDMIVRELPEETRQRILLELECASKSPLVKECDREFYKIVHDTVSRPTAEIADELIGDLPSRERASRLHKPHIVGGNDAD